MITRLCEACKELIKSKEFKELSIRVLKTNDGENQDTRKQVYGEYCNKCINNGKAIEDLKLGL